MVNEDANAKLIRELKEEIQKLRELLKAEGIEIHEGKCYVKFVTCLFYFWKNCVCDLRDFLILLEILVNIVYCT